uniref:Ig-like domain-containing protein n=1 Tax=Salarias fasciatus TaxID=181472 RepID=A0A672HGB2_SALFA
MKTKQRDHMLLAAMSLGMNTTLAQKDNVLQARGEVTADEGHSVTLDCLYNTTSSSNYYLFWYKQEGNKSPKFILSRFKVGEGKTEDEEKYSSTLDSSLRSVPLKIQKLELSDSAVYYSSSESRRAITFTMTWSFTS